MSSLEQVSQPSVAVSRDRSRAIFGQTMGLVALTCLVAALGAYLGRDISRGWGIVAFIGAIGCIIGLNFAIRSSEQLAIGLLFGMGAFLGIAVAPTLAYYAEVQPQALWQAAALTGLFIGGCGDLRVRDASRPLEDRSRRLLRAARPDRLRRSS